MRTSSNMRTTPATVAQALQSISTRARTFSPAWNRCAVGPSVLAPPVPILFSNGETPDGAGARDLPLQRLEAVLMVAREPLNSRKLAQLAQLEDGTQARTLVRKLNSLYDAQGRAFRIEEVAGGYQALTRAKFASWLRRLGHVPDESRLSTPALETLAVVAYRQPVLKADIEAIRGVQCGEILRQLMERDLVRIGGRSEELGRPYLYATTRRFLQQFGLRSLEQLPRAEILKSAALPPVGKTGLNGHHTLDTERKTVESDLPPDKESDVSVTLSPTSLTELEHEQKFARVLASPPPVRLDDDDFEDEEVDEDEDDLDDDLDDDEEDDDEEEDDDLEEEEWEEVEDDEELDEDDEEWDDEDDEDWEDDDEEELDDDEDDEDDDWDEDEEEEDEE